MKRTRKSVNSTEEKGRFLRRLRRSSPMSSHLPKDFSDLPRDLAEEVLCRVPVTSLRRLSSTCKKWNTLSRSRSFAKKHLAQQARVAAPKEFMVVMMMDFEVYLMSVNLHTKVDLYMKRQGILVYSDDDASDQKIYVRQVFHCDGLLLCILKDNPRFVVFNPYCGQPRWFEPIYGNHTLDSYSYALGYDSSTKSHKILRFAMTGRIVAPEFKIYDFNSDSWWNILDVTRDWFIIDSYSRGVSLKGNTYWFAQDTKAEALGQRDHSCLFCFDFTREAFGPRLPVPFELYNPDDTVTLSNVRDEQLAVLFQRVDTLQMEIWVTTKIEPNSVSWSSKFFLSADMRALTANDKFRFSYMASSFFIDEEKKVVVVFDKGKDTEKMMRNTAYIIGEDGSLKEVDLGESPNKFPPPFVCPYVPSSVLLE